tara:strand:+ start:355 stop:1053 length:699 start_codon:yes stop_codon:yes gene_type:complete
MKNIFISGISSGIGRGLAEYYANKGVKVYGVSRRELPYQNDHIKHARLDLNDYQQTPHIISKLLKDVDLDLAILNAGILGSMSSMKDANLEEMKNVMETNLWSQKVLLDSLIETTTISNIFGISSGAAINGNVGWSGYSLSKAAFNMLIQLYAKENPSIQFIAFAPGLVDTAMQDYLCGEIKSSDFPSVKKLHDARGTDNMPTPVAFAKKFDDNIEKVCSMESGSFVDVRKI